MNSKLLLRLRKNLSQALVDHQMIQPGDHILVGLSGGKDSWALLGLLTDLKPRAPIPFTISAVTIDGGLVGFEPTEIEKGCAALKVPFHFYRQNIFETVAEKKDEGTTFCSMCSKLRRGALYQAAKKIGATKLALGHHLDDAIETLMLNLFYGGRSAALPPVLLSNAGNVPILRPLIYCPEEELREYAEINSFPVVGCICPVCPTHPDHEFTDLKRKMMKRWLHQLTLEIPDWRSTVRTALRKLEPTRFLDADFSEKTTQMLHIVTNFDKNLSQNLRTKGIS